MHALIVIINLQLIQRGSTQNSSLAKGKFFFNFLGENSWVMICNITGTRRFVHARIYRRTHCEKNIEKMEILFGH